MTAIPAPRQVGHTVANQSPWILIAVLLHVVAIAVASIVYYAHETQYDEATPTEIRLTATQQKIDVEEKVIVDRLDAPKMQHVEIEPNLSPAVVSDSDDEPEQGDPTDSTSTMEELTALPSGDTTGGSAIGAGSLGHHGFAPSPSSGKNPGFSKYGERDKRGTGAGGPGGRPVNEAIDAGLEWLKKHQDEDGRWSAARFMKHDTAGVPCDGPGSGANDVGVTGLALLAFLGEGSTLKHGTYRREIRKGIKWLVEQQEENGLIGGSAGSGFAYSHAIATTALCEAYGLSQHAPYRQFAQKAANYIANARNPYGVWRYQPREPDGDSSITAWMVQALLSAKAFDLQVDDAALKTSLVFFDSVSDPATGAAGYTKAGEGSSRPVGKETKFPANRTQALTGAVLMCRYLMEQDPKDTPIMAKAADTIVACPPVWDDQAGTIDMYYWYYGSYAMYQVGGTHWKKWSEALTKAALRTQRTDGNAKGSWDPVDPWGEDGGRVYSTAIMVLCLEAYFRYGRVSFALGR